MWFYDGFRPGDHSRACPFAAAPRPLPIRHTIMALTLDDVYRIAHLARIEIDAAEAADVHAKLDAIFGVLDALRAIDTTGVMPMAHAQDVALPLREDVVTEPDRRDAYQRLAPAVQDGLYLVPRVVE